MKPAFVMDQNVYMGGTDHVDQQHYSISSLRKCHKWFKKLVYLCITCNLYIYVTFIFAPVFI